MTAAGSEVRTMRLVEYRKRFLFSLKVVAANSLIMALTMGTADGQAVYNPYEAMSSPFRNYSRPGGLNPFETMSGNRSQSNTFQEDMDALFGGRETSKGLSRDSNRYYNAFRRYDEAFDRIYRPNMEVDQIYNERRSSRESVYFKAFREKNPRKRAELMRAFQRGEDLSSVRDDSKEDETKAAQRRRSSVSRSRLDDRSGGLRSGSDRFSDSPRGSGLLDSPRDSPLPQGRRSTGGLLGGRIDSDSGKSDNSSQSLTERSGRITEQLRPNAPSRGYGPFRSREELLNDETKKSSGGRESGVLPGLLP